MSEPATKQGAQPLKQLGGFELLTKIGQGGMGAVFKARQISLDRVVALKVLPPSIAKDKKFIERFQREARASAKLNHPNIVQGVDVGQDEATGVWYFAMELIEGPTLLSVLKKEGKLDEKRVLEIGRDMAGALECAASLGFVHRDIKPDNILLTKRGEAKLADLGLAKQINDDASLTQSGQAVGTPFYMAPEQVKGQHDQIDIRTDIYALGGTLFHLVTGQPPFAGQTSAVIMSKHLTEAVPKAIKVNPDVSEGCSRLIEKMMQKEREKRIQTPQELRETIERILRGETGVRSPVTTTRKNAPIRKREKKHSQTELPRMSQGPAKPEPSRMPMILGGVGVVALVGAYLVFSKPKPHTEPVVARVEQHDDAKAKTHAAEEAARLKREHEREAERKAAANKPETPKGPAPVVEPEHPVAPETKPESKPDPAEVKPAVTSDTPDAIVKKPDVTVAPTATPAVKPVDPATATAPATPVTPWPFPEILAALRENSPKKAQEAVREVTNPGKDVMLEALKTFDIQRDARLAALAKRVGEELSLDTVKGVQNGKLASLNNGVLRLERAIFINGESRGASQVSVPVDDLTPATFERLAPSHAPSTPPEWIAATLTALAAGNWDAADERLSHLAGNDLHDPLTAEIKLARVKEREAQAKSGWARLEIRLAETLSQAKAKLALEELTAYQKKFADSDFVAAPDFAAKAADMKDQFERMSLGMDARIAKLFQGRVLNYDPRTQVISLGYDLQTKEQTEDWIGSLWAPPGDQTGLTWKKGELKTFCKGTADRVFEMPQFVSSTLHIQLDCKKIDTSRRNRFEVDVSFFATKSDGKALRMYFRADEKGSYFMNQAGTVFKTSDEILFKTDGLLDLTCVGNALQAKFAGKVILEYVMPMQNDRTGFWIGGGWDSGITFTKIQVSGRLEPNWLAKALEAAPKK